MDRNRVDDADDRRVDRRGFPAERLAGRAPFDHDEHFLVDARADAVDGEDRRAARRVVRVQRLHQHQLRALELAMLLRRNDGPDDLSDLHAAIRNPRSALPDVPPIDDADDARVDRRLGWIKRKARFLAADEEHLVADARADRIDSDQRTSDRLSIRRQRLHDEQREAGKRLVLARGHDVADHARDLHYSLTSTMSMMPTMTASTGQSFIPDAIRAELPLTTSTVSPTPASTVSTATR